MTGPDDRQFSEMRIERAGETCTASALRREEAVFSAQGETPYAALEALHREQNLLFHPQDVETRLPEGERIRLSLRFNMREDPPARYWAWREVLRKGTWQPTCRPARGATPAEALGALG